MATCPNCGSETAEGAVFCDQCGTRLSMPEAAAPEAASAPAGGSMICPACGAGNVPGEAFCDFCGSPLEAPVPTVEQVPAPEPASIDEEPQVAPEAPVEEVGEPEVGEPKDLEAGPPAEETPTCPACSAEILPGEAFCATCGASLAQPPIPPEPVAAVEAEPEIEGPPPEAAPELEPEGVAEEAPPAAEATPAPVAEEAPPEPAVEQIPPPPPPPAAEVLACPACSVELEPGDKFCSNCGFQLDAAPAAAPAEEVPTAAPPAPPPPVGARLIVSASGAEIPLPSRDELLIGREDPVSGIYPDVDLTPHGGEEGGVSRQHARLIIEDGKYFVEDLDSTNFTFVNKQKLAPKTRHPVKDGDEIRCGRVALVLRT